MKVLHIVTELDLIKIAVKKEKEGPALYRFRKMDVLLRTTTVPIVVQKNTPGQSEESTMANTTVVTKTTTSIKMPPIILELMLPLNTNRHGHKIEER